MPWMINPIPNNVFTYLFFIVKNNFVESRLLATIGLYQKGKKVTLVIEKSLLLFVNTLVP